MSAPWIRAGSAYFAAVFAVGFVFGTIRVLLIIPRIGEMAAVMLEGPLLLAVSWIFCRKFVSLFAVPSRVPDLLAMGCLALTLTLIAEAAISVFLAGRTIPEHLQLYRLTHVQIGLLAQFAFALFPALQNKAA